jgi:hypothetical protein
MIGTIRTELSNGGIGDGTVFIGEVKTQPGRLSLMWMLRDEPILLDVPRGICGTRRGLRSTLANSWTGSGQRIQRADSQ